jgi:hypothetical protein
MRVGFPVAPVAIRRGAVTLAMSAATLLATELSKVRTRERGSPSRARARKRLLSDEHSGGTKRSIATVAGKSQEPRQSAVNRNSDQLFRFAFRSSRG